MMSEILRNIFYIARRFKLATAFNIIGLIVSFVTCYLLMTQVIYEVTYNHGLEDYGRLYRLETDFVYNEWDFSDDVCQPLAEALKEMPEVESHSMVVDVMTGNNIDYYTALFKKGDSEVKHVINYGNNTVVSALNSRVLDGSIEWTDTDRKGVIIPASIALEFFGTTQAAGDTLYFRETTRSPVRKALVRGVYEDYPDNCELWNHIYKHLGDDYQYSLNFAFKCVVKFKQVPEDLNAFADAIKRTSIRNLRTGLDGDPDLPDMIKSINGTRIKLTPLKSSYFEHNSFTSGDSGYKWMFIILVLACLLVIIIAIINFLNFTLAESPMRVRSLNTRQVLGASRRSLRLGMVAECVITSVTACLMALVVCHLISKLPSTSLISEGSISLSEHWALGLCMLGIAIAGGIIAGLYPAIFATSFKPADALKGNSGLTPQGRRLRTVLVGLQLFIAQLLIIYIGILQMQSRYIYNTSYGYDKSQLLSTTLPIITDEEILNKIDDVQEAFKNKLMAVPGVENVAFSDVQLGSTDGHNSLRTREGEHFMRFCHMYSSADFMRTMGIPIVKGRDFLPTDTAAIIINEATLKKWDWLKPGMKISVGFDEESNDSATVVGVCKDIRYSTTRISNDDPFFIIRAKNCPCYTLNVRIAANTPPDQVRRLANEVIHQQFGNDAHDLVFFNNTLEKAYADEFRFFQLIYYLSIICLITTLIGVLCLTMFDTEYRRKEIGIRKVAGASTGEIIMMFCRHYGKLILISFAAAAPIALISGYLTLEYFAEHTAIPWWAFPVGLLLVGSVTLATVALQSWRAARENPVNSLKTE